LKKSEEKKVEKKFSDFWAFGLLGFRTFALTPLLNPAESVEKVVV
jgi:hypothetical protein